ncbi:MAG: tRNA (N(6)-L-threonylcarbamoyladenosine(37)-C(2))-methylthiotransferase MtaB [Culicoidibacterales bacterium]
MKTIAIQTLGCKVNTYESEAVFQMFEKEGYTKVDFKDIADVYIINTCTVTNMGDKKSRQMIRRAVRQNPDAVVVVMGCYAQIAHEEVSQIEGVDIVIGTKHRDQLVQFVREFQEKRQPIKAIDNIMRVREYESLPLDHFTENTRAFLKIQEGCNNFCTFCIIPWARGLIRSEKPEVVIEKAQKLVDNGFYEIVLTGIHTAGYGEDLEDYEFGDLLNDLSAKVNGLKRLRISSIETSQITEKVLQALRDSNIVVDHLHVPLQSGSDSILKAMHRKYTTAEFAQKIEEIRMIFPDIAITTDVIVGFPGETDDNFQEMYDFIERIQFSELHVFPYSKRSGTPAAKMDNQVSEITKTMRVSELITLSERLAHQYAKRFENKIMDVIVEMAYERDGKSYVSGHASNYLNVEFEGDISLLKQHVTVQVKQAGFPKVFGVLV